MNITDMSLSHLARAIRADWTNVNFAAQPYFDAMLTLDNISDMYGADSGRSIVAYFLNNAGSWRGPVAREVKAELRRRLA